MNELTLKLSVPELNKVLASLGHQPYMEVFELINKLHVQAQEQLGAEPEVKSGRKQAQAEVVEK